MDTLPAPPQTISSQPAAVQQKGKAKDVAPESCVICLDAISERAITVPCNHCSFDFLCLASWLQQRSTCPLCKADVSQVQYDWRSPEDFKTYNVQSTAPAASAARSHARPFVPRRNRRRPPRRSPSPSPDIALIRRRHVYRNELFSMHVGTNRISRYANFTPHMVAASPDLQSRARAFIRRELRVFSFLYPEAADDSETASRRVGNAEFLLEYMLAILKKMDIKGPTGQAEDMLQEFIGRNHARLFLHELGAWLRSPYTRLEDWDRHVQYREPLPTCIEDTEDRRNTPATAKPPSEGTHAGPSRPYSRARSYRSSPYQRRGAASPQDGNFRRYDPD
ncbi:ring finger domain-containing protein [Diplodia corticola]|uniref:RING-type E3 ubiquitin transferase n=1 Tax=Diplodia corticola TaxID=236234 RepID=A0A1J9RCW0_9PEZI|nr:ring finger domain-containing protein [Diplodia corticola]OJD37946.1 ring finger domain-containing protein [Diplodia corticola]